MSFNYSNPEECRAWLARKAPYLGHVYISIFGKTSTGKSSFLNQLIGAYVAPVKDVACSNNPGFVAAVSDARFQRLSLLQKRHEPLQVVNLEDLGPDDIPKITPGVAKSDYLWPRPLPSGCDPESDARFGDLYISDSSNFLRPFFERLLPSELHPVLAGSRLTVFNVDRLTDDPKSRARLLRTVLIDSKGLDTDRPSPIGTTILKHAHRQVYCLPHVSQDNALPGRAYETMLGQSLYGEAGWRERLLPRVAPFLESFAKIGLKSFTGIDLTPLPSFTGGKGADSSSGSQHGVGGLAGSGLVDPGVDSLWNKTMFLRTKLDLSLSHDWGYEGAVQDAGTALGHFLVTPVNKRVRHVALLGEQQNQQTGVLRQRNEFEAVREELLAPYLGGDICSDVARFRHLLAEQDRTKKAWQFDIRKGFPAFTGINTDDYHAKQIEIAQKCKSM
jgi:hypothetical protein